MKKDIIVPKVEGVFIVIKHEWDDDFLNQSWNCYLVNDSNEPLETAMVMTRGTDGTGRKTTTLRHAFNMVAAKSNVKFEPIMEDVFGFTNEFIVTFFKGDTLYDKTYTALPRTIGEQHKVDLKVMDGEGIILD